MATSEEALDASIEAVSETFARVLSKCRGDTEIASRGGAEAAGGSGPGDVRTYVRT